MILFLFCLFTSFAKAQEKVNTFHIVDSATKIAVPSVSVVIVKAKLAITTEKDGIFNIPGDLAKMSDTLILSAQNYTTLKLPLRILHKIDSLYLVKASTEIVAATSSMQSDSVLNDYDRKDIVHYAGIHTETSLFENLQLAQQFDVTKSGLQLNGVVVNRLAFSVDFNLAGLEVTTFRIRIYDVDATTGGPGKDLCRHLIEIKDKDSRQFKVNLSQYNIILPHKTFFVDIEWLRDFRNMGYATVFDEKSGRSVQHINYRPAIGISPLKGPKLNIWGLNMKREWKPYTYFLPDYTDLAIKATIAY
ncbi:MAG: hypothetical protein EOO88_23115 [Pedobacter sp.]|nr:MAG: hypothetical protein EOO88_23115 [Pedobacter sp.]